jgi:hypothetical protein
MDKKITEGQKELLEWYDDMPKDAFTNPHGETDFAFPVGGATPPPVEVDAQAATQQPKMEIEIKPKEDEVEHDNISDIESWAEIHKAKAFAKALLIKIDFLSGDSPEGKNEETLKKCKNEIKALASKVVEIINKVK